MTLENLREVCAGASGGRWEWSGDPDDSAIHSHNGGCVAFVQPHGNVRTVERTGEQYSHADARFIATFNPEMVSRLIAIAEVAQRCTQDFRTGPDGVVLDDDLAVALDEAVRAVEEGDK